MGARTSTQEAWSGACPYLLSFVVSKNVSSEWSRHIFLDFRWLWGQGVSRPFPSHPVIVLPWLHCPPPSLPSPFDQQLVSLKTVLPLLLDSGCGTWGSWGFARPGRGPSCLDKGPRETWKQGRNESTSHKYLFSARRLWGVQRNCKTPSGPRPNSWPSFLLEKQAWTWGLPSLWKAAMA